MLRNHNFMSQLLLLNILIQLFVFGLKIYQTISHLAIRVIQFQISQFPTSLIDLHIKTQSLLRNQKSSRVLKEWPTLKNLLTNMISKREKGQKKNVRKRSLCTNILLKQKRNNQQILSRVKMTMVKLFQMLKWKSLPKTKLRRK